jgi:hypothetical protein
LKIAYRITVSRCIQRTRVRELAGTLKGVLAFAGEGFIREKRQLFEDLHMRVLVSDRQLQAVELALPAIKSEGDTVLQHS